MAEYKFNLALNASTFPLIARYLARNVIIGPMDNRLRDPSTSPQSNYKNNPQNFPQVLYCENVVPRDDGCMSVGYSDSHAAFPGAGAGDDVFEINTASSTTTWLFVPAQGMNYVANTLANPWVSTNPLAGAPLADPAIVPSIASVNGTSYVCYRGTALLRWDGGAGFTNVSGALLGVAIGNIKAICGAGNYLVIVCTDNSVKWSSLTNPLDFVPSVVSGAGSQIPLDLRGQAYYLSSIAGGFLIHCQGNVVAAVYTQNTAQPWIFREVKNSGGIVDDFSGVSREVGTGYVYQFGSFGMQQLNLRDAENIHPDVTDFISSRLWETFDTATNLLSIALQTYIYTKVSFLVGRFLCISYGLAQNNYSYVLIFDTSLKRWGKLKIDHADIFANIHERRPLEALNVLLTTGACKRIVLDKTASVDSGVLILGRYQLSRTSQICSQELELEVLNGTEVMTAHVVSNYNGTTLGEIQPMVAYAATDNYRSFQKQLEGENLSYILKGTFSLTSATLTVTKGAASNS